MGRGLLPCPLFVNESALNARVIESFQTAGSAVPVALLKISVARVVYPVKAKHYPFNGTCSKLLGYGKEIRLAIILLSETDLIELGSQ